MNQVLTKVVMIATFIVLTFLLIGMSNQPVNAANLINGEEKFTVNCLVCHGKKGLGDGPAAAQMSKKPSNINKKLNSLFKSKAQLTQKVLAGKTGMPAFKGILSVSDVDDIFSYIQSVNL